VQVRVAALKDATPLRQKAEAAVRETIKSYVEAYPTFPKVSSGSPGGKAAVPCRQGFLQQPELVALAPLGPAGSTTAPCQMHQRFSRGIAGS
jgi:hypothetical protein